MLKHSVVAVIPCNDLDISEAFYNRLGFVRPDGERPADAAEDTDEAAAAFAGELIEKEGPEKKPWGMYEFSLSDPDGALVRVGWPLRLRT
jgi:predicted lactoylglutathione lyase